MSTRSYICRENEDGTILGVYCHSDGYIEHNGLFLYAFYKTQKQVNDLIGLGHLSTLGTNIGHQIDFNKRYVDTAYYEKVKYQCCAYSRDRGEEFCIDKWKSREDCYKAGEEYIYIYRNNEWYVKMCGKKLQKLENVLKANDYVRNKSYQEHYLTDTAILEDDRRRLLEAFTNLGVLDKELKDSQFTTNADYVVLEKVDAKNYKVRCTVNNSIVYLTKEDLIALQEEGCKVAKK